MFLQAAQAAVQPRHKLSPALLNMRHIERTLAFQKEFAKADKVCAISCSRCSVTLSDSPAGSSAGTKLGLLRAVATLASCCLISAPLADNVAPSHALPHALLHASPPGR